MEPGNETTLAKRQNNDINGIGKQTHFQAHDKYKLESLRENEVVVHINVMIDG